MYCWAVGLGFSGRLKVWPLALGRAGAGAAAGEVGLQQCWCVPAHDDLLRVGFSRVCSRVYIPGRLTGLRAVDVIQGSAGPHFWGSVGGRMDGGDFPQVPD